MKIPADRLRDMDGPSLLETGMAKAVDLENMGKDLPPDTRPDSLLELPLCAETDILDPSAGHTDEMMMVFFIPAEIVIQLPVRMDDPRNHAPCKEFFEVAIDGRESQRSEPLFHPLPDILRTEIDLLAVEHLKHGNPLGC